MCSEIMKSPSEDVVLDGGTGLNHGAAIALRLVSP